MSKKSDEIEARRKALGLKVISSEATAAPGSNVVPLRRPPSAQDHMVGTGYERRRPAGGEFAARSGVPGPADYPAQAGAESKVKVATVDGDAVDTTLQDQATTFAQWLEEQYHSNVAPFGFLADVALNVETLPSAEVVATAVSMLKARGWQIGVNRKCGNGYAASFTMMHPDSVGL